MYPHSARKFNGVSYMELINRPAPNVSTAPAAG
jgi:hypothetical protein